MDKDDTVAAHYILKVRAVETAKRTIEENIKMHLENPELLKAEKEK